MTAGPILGPDGVPVRKPKEAEPLSLELQAYIEARVASELTAVRDTLRQEAALDRRNRTVTDWIRYGVFVLVSALFGLFLWLFGSSEVRELTKKYVAENMAKPALETAAKDVVTNQMAQFVSEKLNPLEDRVNQTGSNLTTRTVQVEDLIQHVQGTLKKTTNTLETVQLVAAALVFDVHAYDELANVELSTNAPLNEIAWRARMNATPLARMMRISEKGLDMGALTNLIDVKKATFAEYTNRMAIIPDVIPRCMFLSQLATEGRFPKVQVFDYMVHLLKTERNILVIQHIEELMDTEARLTLNFTARQRYVAWWQTNRSNYVHPPEGHETIK